MKTDALSLYVHIPFCVKKCNYCDFCSFSEVNVKDRRVYIDGLLRELSEYKKQPKLSLATVFFGGGTPSLLTASEFEEITEKIREVFDLKAECEFTVESNPKTLTREKLVTYKRCGVNRLSIGLQSIHENELKILGRIHSFNDFLESFSIAREVGIENINVDIMYSIPAQTPNSFRETLGAVMALSPEHISAYSLILEEGTPLFLKKDSLSFPTVEEECLMYDTLCELMAGSDYLHYEISNYAKSGFECRHNLVYWRAKEYIGVGLAAHSYLCGVRFSNTEILSEYLTENYKEYRTEEKIDKDARGEEHVMLALRTSEGIDILRYRELFDKDFLDGKEKILKQLTDSGLAVLTDTRFALTEKGFYVSNEIICNLT